MIEDYYELLGLEDSATPEQLKKSFRELALKYHPDQHPSAIANALFRAIHEAYQVLSDPEQRRRYDEQRRTRLRLRGAVPRPPAGSPSTPSSKAAPAADPPRPRPAGGPSQDQRTRDEGARRMRFRREQAAKVQAASREVRRQNDELMREILGDPGDGEK